MRRFLAALWVFCLGAATAFADGGALILHQRSGSLNVSVFASPSPLRVGVADFSALIQNAATGKVLLGGQIEIELSKARQSTIKVNATTGQATNKLLYAAAVQIPQGGEWTLIARCRVAGETVLVQGSIEILGAEPGVVTYWPYFAVVPLAILLFALNQYLKAKRRSARLQVPP